ncbi:MAG: hypothetical protein ABI614_04310 [Planctomycetota bacterium]
MSVVPKRGSEAAYAWVRSANPSLLPFPVFGPRVFDDVIHAIAIEVAGQQEPILKMFKPELAFASSVESRLQLRTKAALFCRGRHF